MAVSTNADEKEHENCVILSKGVRVYCVCICMYDKELAVICLYFPACITLMHDIQLAASVWWLRITANLLLIITHYTAKYSDWWLRFLRIYKIIIPLIAGLMEPIVQMQNLCVINEHVALLRKNKQLNFTLIDLRFLFDNLSCILQPIDVSTI